MAEGMFHTWHIIPVNELGRVGWRGQSLLGDGLGIGQWGMSNNPVVHYSSFWGFLTVLLSLLLLDLLLLLYYCYYDFTLFPLLNCSYLNPQVLSFFLLILLPVPLEQQGGPAVSPLLSAGIKP